MYTSLLANKLSPYKNPAQASSYDASENISLTGTEASRPSKRSVAFVLCTIFGDVTISVLNVLVSLSSNTPTPVCMICTQNVGDACFCLSRLPCLLLLRACGSCGSGRARFLTRSLRRMDAASCPVLSTDSLSGGGFGNSNSGNKAATTDRGSHMRNAISSQLAFMARMRGCLFMCSFNLLSVDVCNADVTKVLALRAVFW